jgi:hypothetical protein
MVLSEKLTDRLINKEEPEDYANYCASVQKVTNDLQA